MNSRGPLISSAQVKAADALAHERFGIATDWLMEAAGWQLARFCNGGTVVACGVGNNAGDGLAAARHLLRWGRLASVACVDAGRLHGPAEKELQALRKLGVSVDVPSGLDSDTGVAYAPSVQAHTTVTLGLPKAGLTSADGPRLAGEVWVADIGMPFEVYAELGIVVPPTLFSAQDRFRL